MPAFLYEKKMINNALHFKCIKEISLGGRQIIYRNWIENKNKFGEWKISPQELLNKIDKNSYSTSEYTILIDGKPNSETELEFFEIDDICVYTFKNEYEVKADWSLLLLKCQLIFCSQDKSLIDKIRETKSFSPQDVKPTPVRTFLYLRGCDAGWNWGRLGQMNGAWLYPDALKYFMKNLP